MSYQINLIDDFLRDLKPLAKRNPKLRQDLDAFLQELPQNVDVHPVIPGTNGARKARMKASGRGKQGGYRVIYYFAHQTTIWLIAIYDKVQTENLSPTEGKRIADFIQQLRDSS